MGYTTNGTGWIDINPACPVSMLADVDLSPLAAERVEQRTDHDDGSYTAVPVYTRLLPEYEEEWRAEPDEVAEVVNRVRMVLGDGFELTGHIYAEGEESGDVWRVQADGTVQRAELRWPDGEPVDCDVEWARYPWRTHRPFKG